MNLRTRSDFQAIMDYEPHDHMPVWYFGTWPETKVRWSQEGLDGIALTGDAGPDIAGMDPDWELGMWELHGLMNPNPISPNPREVLEESATQRVVRTELGAIHKESKVGSSIPQHLQEALPPTRDGWERFRRFLDADDPSRRALDWQARVDALNARERVTTILGGSLYGWPRDWLGTEHISYLCYDDPALFEEIIATMADYFMRLCEPVLRSVQFDFVYFFEDCCGSSGPLFSPATYRRFYARHYRRMIDFYHGLGVRRVLIDSDGDMEALIPCWLDSGFDIFFPVEVGTWQASPARLRQKYGKALRMMGGVDKHVIPQGARAIREHLEALRAVTDEGGFIPFPDHRIPPDCSLAQFKTYVAVFDEVFNARK
jgi:Uroporphyrinogen decarboxylase (URO-D)